MTYTTKQLEQFADNLDEAVFRLTGRRNTMIEATSFRAVTAELIAAHKRIAELEALRKPAIYSAAVIGSFYEWVERVEKAGGPTCISGIAECNAMIKSLRKNAKRADELVMKPLREAIAALEAKP